MLIAIHDSEQEHLKNKTFPNLALMKISAYHKNLGDNIEWFNPLINYDKVYSSKVFDFTPVNNYLPAHTIKSGYEIYEDLPKEIDDLYPDYFIYPNYAIGFLTRGCINNCEWCYVPRKEGDIKPYSKWQDIVRNDTQKLVLMDNNVLACDYGIEQLRELTETNYKIDLNQGIPFCL